MYRHEIIASLLQLVFLIVADPQIHATGLKSFECQPLETVKVDTTIIEMCLDSDGFINVLEGNENKKEQTEIVGQAVEYSGSLRLNNVIGKNAIATFAQRRSIGRNRFHAVVVWKLNHSYGHPYYSLYIIRQDLLTGKTEITDKHDTLNSELENLTFLRTSDSDKLYLLEFGRESRSGRGHIWRFDKRGIASIANELSADQVSIPDRYLIDPSSVVVLQDSVESKDDSRCFTYANLTWNPKKGFFERSQDKALSNALKTDNKK